MRRTIAYAASILAGLPWISPATAATLTNRDTREHSVMILEKAQASASRALKPEESIEGICRKGCIIRIGASETSEYIVEGNELLSIEGGEVFLTGTEPGALPAKEAR